MCPHVSKNVTGNTEEIREEADLNRGPSCFEENFVEYTLALSRAGATACSSKVYRREWRQAVSL